MKDYWGVDDDTVVFVADPGAEHLNFSVGANVDLEVPPSFWTRLREMRPRCTRENGEAASGASIVTRASVGPGKLKCAKVQGEFGEEPSSGKFGKAWFGS